MRVKKGDKIIVTAGKDKGRKGTVDRVYEKSGSVVVKEVNIYKKHIRKNDQMPQGGVVDIPRPLDAAKIALICPKCGKPTRIRYEVEKNGRKFRICSKCKSRI